MIWKNSVSCRPESYAYPYHILLTTPINFYHAFYILPIRLNWDESTKNFIASSTLIHKAICALVYSSFVFFRFLKIANHFTPRQGNYLNEQRNPLFSQVGFLFSAICLPFIVTWISWKGHVHITFTFMSTELKKLSTRRKNGCDRSNEHFSNISPWRLYLVTGVICIAPIISAIVNFQTSKPGSEYTTLSTYFINFLDKLSINENVFLQFTSYPLNYAVHVFIIWVRLPNAMFETFGILVATSCLWYVFWFEQSLEECDDIEKARDLIKQLKTFIYLGNEKAGVGYLILINFVDTILSYSEKIEQTLFSSSSSMKNSAWAEMTQLNVLYSISVECTMTVCLWVIAAEINRRISNAVTNWIEGQHAKLELSIHDQVKVLGIGYTFDRKTAGISCIFFSVTYSFLGSMIGLMITYTLLAHQSTASGKT